MNTFTQSPPRQDSNRRTGEPIRALHTLLGASVVMLGFVGCAFDLSRVKQQPASFAAAEVAAPSFTLRESVKVSLGTGYSRTLQQGTRWRHAGSITQGEVYRTDDQILTVEASNIFEAYLVVSNGSAVGFYLPAEKTFSPLPKPAVLSTQNQP